MEKPPNEEAVVCINCGCRDPKIFVHGHYQCSDCKCVTDGDCCQGAYTFDGDFWKNRQ